MISKTPTAKQSNQLTIRENLRLRAELEEARDALTAIAKGEVDAFVVNTKEGDQIFTLKSAEHPYRVMVEAMNEGAVTLLRDGTIMYCNHKFGELLSHSTGEISGRKIFEFIAKKDHSYFALMFAQSHKSPSKGELFLVGASDLPVDVHISMGPVDFDGVAAVSMIVTDLTERKQNEALIASENLTRSILDQAAEAIIVCDDQGFIIRANPEAQRLVGSDLLLKPFCKAFDLSLDSGEAFTVKDLRQLDRKTRALPVSLNRAGQSPLYLSMSISHLRQIGVGLWRVITLTDITPLRKIEKLKSAKDAAESANSLKTTFLANMSHEIRTPLGAIIGFTELLKEPGLLPALQTQYLDIIARSGNALTVLIDDILDLSKVEAGCLRVEKIPVSLETLLSDVVALFSEKTRLKGIELFVERAADVPERILSDPSRLRQILINIVGNAVKFTQAGHVKIVVSVNADETHAPLLRFQVCDTGEGLTQEQQLRLFAPFSQGDESTTRRYGGTGLGLVLSRRLAQALGGDVGVEFSESTVGSIFGITVALVIDESSVVSNTVEKVVVDTSAITGLKVLVVEDAPENQILLSRILTKRGAVVAFANNGREGVDKALAGSYDIVFMDIQMPVLDGYAATKELRALGYRTPIVALTAYAMEEERQRCLAIGCSAHLSKPIDTHLVLQTILKTVANRP
jgi:PAS domain S-box-containing protein